MFETQKENEAVPELFTDGRVNVFDPEAVRTAIENVLRPIGLSWPIIEQQASEAILFGSRAAGVWRTDSDWDLLLVGTGFSIHTKELDLIWVTPEDIWSRRWLESELASHIGVYGRWLLGLGIWRSCAHVSSEAATRKKASLQFQLAHLHNLWFDLLPNAQARHVRRLRRDVQRLHLLRSGTAVPPTYELDEAWHKFGVPSENLEALFAEVASDYPGAYVGRLP